MSADVVRNLVLDHWYKVVIALASVVLVLSLTLPLQFPNKAVFAMALGALIFGFGQWINHPLQTQLGPGVKITSYNRKARLSGVLTELGGVVIFALGLYLLLKDAL